MFVEASDLEYVLKYTAKQEKTHKVWKKVFLWWCMLSANLSSSSHKLKSMCRFTQISRQHSEQNYVKVMWQHRLDGLLLPTRLRDLPCQYLWDRWKSHPPIDPLKENPGK
jgi:hypothetical protein